jgi:hypothetical protein
MTRKSIKYLIEAATPEQLVSDEDLDRAFAHTNFGETPAREVIRLGALKCLAGWRQGHTSMTIGQELGLISDKYKITAKGRAYIWLACKKGGDV